MRSIEDTGVGGKSEEKNKSISNSWDGTELATVQKGEWNE